MGYLIAYFLLVLAVDLVCKARQPAALNKTVVVRRRLWNDSNFDCYSVVFSTKETTSVPAKSFFTSPDFNRKNDAIPGVSFYRNSKALLQYSRGEKQKLLYN
ncbi:hypothetical protein [Desulfobulbus oligotrophicus]|jgi:hypothetical protein|uniref:Uncharacterized protein n=1 Tax=Desulfobulbus oligotrophicus TaxID=1909699 RepID=A0A7T5VE07_9BACT|nr:hypothetical protein [Desulfobulbus oligotrophicus]QQG66162.1 hypothetical protein HP555_09950 [Desulfobulbus oligotrophicus]